MYLVNLVPWVAEGIHTTRTVADEFLEAHPQNLPDSDRRRLPTISLRRRGVGRAVDICDGGAPGEKPGRPEGILVRETYRQIARHTSESYPVDPGQLRSCSTFAEQVPHGFRKVGPRSRESASIEAASAALGLTLADSGQSWPHFNQQWPKLADVGKTFGRCGPRRTIAWSCFAKFWKVARHRPTTGPNRPKWVELEPASGTVWPPDRRFSQNLGRFSAPLAIVRQLLDIFQTTSELAGIAKSNFGGNVLSNMSVTFA